MFKMSRKAVTLIEMLLVVSLFALTALAVFHFLINGLKIWDQGQQLGVIEDVAIFSEKISQELRNAFPFSQFGFSGTKDSLRFPTLVTTLSEGNEMLGFNEYVKQIGEVEYEFNQATNSIYRRQANYGLSLEGKFFPKRVVLTSIDSLQFNYLYHSEDGSWIEKEEGNAIPYAVKIQIGYTVKGKHNSWVKIVAVPMGG